MAAVNEIRSVEDIYQFFFSSFTDKLLVGVEHEKAIFSLADGTAKRLHFFGEGGIQKLMERFQDHGWEWGPIYEFKNQIELSLKEKHLSLETGGQIEFSGTAFPSLHEVVEELVENIELTKILLPPEAYMLGMGFDPISRLQHIPIIPKMRYEYMLSFLDHVGSYGRSMLTGTSSIQVSLDYSSEKDLLKKLQVSTALQPIIAILFASSPIVEGKVIPAQSYRNVIWNSVYPGRCGIDLYLNEENLSLEAYIHALIHRPMIFIIRDGKYIDAQGGTFAEFMQGKLASFPNQIPTSKDLSGLISTFYPDVRLKQVLEMRSADCAPLPLLKALPAIWTGLLYDEESLNELVDLTADWTYEEHSQLRSDCPTFGLSTIFRSNKINILLKRIIELGIQGLQKRNIKNADGATEDIYLLPLVHIMDSGKTTADYIVETFKNSNGDLTKLIRDWSY